MDSTTLPEYPDRITALEAEVAWLRQRDRERERENATLERILGSDEEAPADSTEGIPECYTDWVAQRARRRRRRESGLTVVRCD